MPTVEVQPVLVRLRGKDIPMAIPVGPGGPRFLRTALALPATAQLTLDGASTVLAADATLTPHAVVHVVLPSSLDSKGGPTVAAALHMFAKGFLGLQAVRVVVAGLGAVAGGRSPLPAMTAACTAPTTLRSSACVGLLLGSNALWRVVVGAARGGVHDRATAAAAGALSALALTLDQPGRYTQLALYLLVRAVHTAATRGVQLSGENQRRDGDGARAEGGPRGAGLSLGRLSELQVAMVGFGLANMPLMYAAYLEPGLLEKGYYNWILRLSTLTDAGLEWTLREPLRQRAAHPDGPCPPLRPCSDRLHPGRTCAQFLVLGMPSLMVRCAKVYAPVHLVGEVLGGCRGLRHQPGPTARRLALGTLRSAAFLSTYGNVMTLAVCGLRNLRGKDAVWHPLVGGALTGTTLFLEQPRRATELMLFCVARAIEVCFRLGVARGYLVPVPRGEVAVLAAALGIILSLQPSTLKPMQARVLSALFGP